MCAFSERLQISVVQSLHGFQPKPAWQGKVWASQVAAGVLF